MSNKKDKKRPPISAGPVEIPLKEALPPIDRNYARPCKKCRKRDSCISRPNDEEKCGSFEEGTPWFETYCNSLPVID